MKGGLTLEFIEIRDKGTMAIMIDNCPYIDLNKTFDCGQCFRIEPVSIFGNKVEYGGVVFDKFVVFAQNHPNELIIYNYGFAHIDIWKKFFNLNDDYEKRHEEILKAVPNQHMKSAIEYGKGIRLLRQSLWETIISFIISQNNNIPRIKKIIESLCFEYGRKTTFKGKEYYTFPDSRVLLLAGKDHIAQKTKMGFRADYVIEASKAFDLLFKLKLESRKTYKEALDILLEIKGIGPKVASCITLFSLGLGESFPIDVHMKRTLDKYFDGSIDLCALGDNAGLAQQYLFYYEKYNQST